jgi:hypothetical protein
MSDPPFEALCADVLRCYAPARLPELPGLLARGAASLAAELEAQYRVPRYFSTLYAYHFSGRFFDPLRALYDGHFVPPAPLSLPLDNVHKASVLLPGGGGPLEVATGRLHGAAVEARDAAVAAGTARPRTLLDTLAEGAPAEGPLGALRALRAAGARVRVQRRDGAPDVCGALAGFDEALNLLVIVGGEGVLIPGMHVVNVGADAPTL